MVTAAAAAADSSAAAAATAAVSTVIASANAFKLKACHVRHECLCFHVLPGNLWGGGGRRTSVLNLNLDAEWVTMHAHNAWALSGGTAHLDKGTLVTLPGHFS